MRAQFFWLLVGGLLALGPSVHCADTSFAVWAGQSFYTTESSGVLVLSGSAVASLATLDGVRVRVETGSTVWEEPVTRADRVFCVSIPLSGFPEGKTSLRCSLLRDGAVLAAAETELMRLAPRANAVPFDRITGCLVSEGRPFVPVGFYCYSPVQPTLAEEEVVRGFNLMSPYQNNRAATRDARRQYMDRCAELGMRVHYQLLAVAGGGGVYGATGSDNQEAALREEVRAFRDHPALLGWYISDEPTGHGTSSERLATIRDTILEEDPYHPVTVVFMRPQRAKDYADALDIVMVDPYPIPVRPPASAGRAVAIVQADLSPAKAVWMVPQCFGGNEHWKREPTGREVRVMSYLGLIEGARGFQYFIRHGLQGFPKSPLLWAECSRFALEVGQLTPYLGSHESAPEVTADRESVRVRAWVDRGAVRLVAVNTKNEPAEVTITFPDLIAAESVTLPFEGRSMTSEALLGPRPARGFFERLAFWRSPPEPSRVGTRLVDHLDAYAVRVYALRQSDSTASVPTIGLPEGNLIINPSFEDNASPGVPEGCYAKVGAGRGATYRVDPTVAADGRHSLRLRTPREGDGVAIEPYRPRVTSGQAYRFSLMARSGSDEGGQLQLGAGKESVTVELTPEWSRYSITCIAPEARNSKLYLMYRLNSPGVAWVDALECLPLAPRVETRRADSGAFLLELENVPSSATVRYTLDGSEPGPDAAVYTQPIPVSESCVLKGQVHIDGTATPVFSETVRRHAANGLVPHFGQPYATQYSGGGDDALTDGLIGTAENLRARWQGFLRDDLDVTVDLGEATPLRQIRARFLQNARSWIWLPTEVVVSASLDGKDYREVGRADHAVAQDSLEETVQVFTVSGDQRPARFVRWQAGSLGLCPDWHAGAGKDCWLFADELEVNPVE